MFNSNFSALFIICVALTGFFIVIPAVLHWLLFAEIFWIGIFFYASINSLALSSLIYISISILLICLATSESALGLSILLFNSVLFNNPNGAIPKKQTVWNALLKKLNV